MTEAALSHIACDLTVLQPNGNFPQPWSSLTFNTEQNQSDSENQHILIDEIHFHLFTKCVTWLSLGGCAFVLTVVESVFTRGMVLNLELSLLNETLKISPNMIFFFDTMLQIATCPRLSGLNCILRVLFSLQHIRTGTGFSLSTLVPRNTSVFPESLSLYV